MNTYEPQNTTKELHPGWISLQRLVDWFDCCFACYSPLPDARRDVDPWAPHRDPGFVDTMTAREARKQYLANPENERVYQPRLFVAVATAEFLGEQHRQVEGFYQRQLAVAHAAEKKAQDEASRLRDERNKAVLNLFALAAWLGRRRDPEAKTWVEGLRKTYGDCAGFPTKK